MKHASSKSTYRSIYFYDTGIRNALIRNFSPLPTRSDAGALWENLFFAERVKTHAFRMDGAELYFWRTRNGSEVDCLEVINGKITAFECKLSGEKKTASMRVFEKTYPGSPVTIVTPNNVETICSGTP